MSSKEMKVEEAIERALQALEPWLRSLNGEYSDAWVKTKREETAKKLADLAKELDNE